MSQSSDTLDGPAVREAGVTAEDHLTTPTDDFTDDDQDDDHDADEDAGPGMERTKPKRQRRKPNRSALSKVKGRRGALVVFNSLPIDLVLEICGYLGPADLYTLSITSKIFRQVVTGPASPALWAEARARVGLPELLVPMTDLQYAALLFSRSGCRYCDRKNAGRPDVYLRSRVCTACLKEHFVGRTTAKGRRNVQAALPYPHAATLHIMPHTNPQLRGGPLYHLQDMWKLDDELKEAFPNPTWQEERFLRDRIILGPDHLQEPVTPFEKWAVTIGEKITPRRQDGEALHEWLKRQEEASKMSKIEILAKRRTELEERFQIQGFGPSDFTNAWAQDPLVKKAELLTERSWTRAEPILRERLLNARRDNRFHEIAKRWAKERSWRSGTRSIFKYILPPSDYSPPADVTRFLPLVQCIVEANSTTVSGEQFYAANRDAIFDAVETVFHERLVALLLLVAGAWNELRAAQVKAAGLPRDEQMQDCVIEGLACSDVPLPRLPAWIPRDPNLKSISATTDQMARFIDSHELAVFVCQKCDNLLGGMDAIKHVLYGWGDCISHPSVSLDEWLPVGNAGDRGLTTNAPTLLRGLKLREVANSVDLVCSDPHLEERAEICEADMPDADKYVVLFDCSCDCQAEPTTKMFGRINAHLNAHGKRHDHKVRVAPRVDYSTAFVNLVNDTFEEMEGEGEVDVWDYGDTMECWSDGPFDGLTQEEADFRFHSLFP